MKASRYNRIAGVADPDARLIFNGASAALAEVDSQTLPIIHRLLRDPASARSDQDHELVEALQFGHFLVEDDLDEIAALRCQNRQSRTANSTLLLTIAPTLACDFACTYCFESQSPVRMSREVEEALVSLVSQRLPVSENVIITWFGGEPTLCVDTIERLQGTILTLAADRGVPVQPASIITNGHRLDRALAGQLHAAGVHDAQVTIDGSRDVHDQRRPLRSGRGTFDTIVENLVEASDILRIVVRVNVDLDNADRVPGVFESLRSAGVLEKVTLYFAPVNAADGICADMRGRCFSTEEFASTQIRLYEKLLDHGVDRIEYPDLAPGSHCGADSTNSYVVGPNGLLFKCWEDLSVSGEASVGSVLTDDVEPHQQAQRDRYESWDPFAKRECPGCAVLPICMGGCPREGLRLDSPDRGGCSSWKFNLEDMLKLRYRCEQRSST